MSYLWAGYLITWAALAAYAWRLGRRSRRAEKRLRAAGDREPPGPGPA